SSPSLAKKPPKGESKPSSKSAAPKGQGPAPRLTCDPTDVKASEGLAWITVLHLFNPLDVGLYTDSVRFHFEDKDPGETRVDRSRDVSAQAMAQAFGSVSAGDSVNFSYSGPASFETGRVTIIVYCHRADGVTYAPTASFNVMPGPVSEQHPSEFVTVE